MNNLNASAIAAEIMVQKQYNSNLYLNMGLAIGSYSQDIGKLLAGFSEIDNGVAGILQSIIYITIEEEAKREGREVQTLMGVKTSNLPVFFAEPNFDPEIDTEAEALRVLDALYSIERHTGQTIEKAAAEPAADQINGTIDLSLLAAASKARAKAIRRTINQIQNNEFWTRQEPINWTCLQCGAVTKSAVAFEECECCHADRAFAASL